MEVLKETDFPWLGNKKTGKVRDIYEQSDRYIFITTDRHSSFDRIIAHIPYKGAVLNLLSGFWFEKTSDITPNHIIEIPDPNITIAKKCTPLPIESIVRGYITGSTNTSLWTLYKNGQRNFGSFTLPEGLKKNEKLEKPVFTPSTKSDIHDRTVTKDEIVTEGLLTAAQLAEVERVSLALYARGAEIAQEKGFILVDTKYEFGYDENGTLTLIDEVHTPDSSRYWRLDSYGARFEQDEEPEYFDKEFLRLWFKENSDPYNDEVLPSAPKEMVMELSGRYITMYEALTGTSFEKSGENTLERLERILKNYA